VWPYIDITAATRRSAGRAGDRAEVLPARVRLGTRPAATRAGAARSRSTTRDQRRDQAAAGIGGDVAVSFGGAESPYLSVCRRGDAGRRLGKVIDAFNISHIDFDVEASIPIDTMNKAIAQVQRDRPGTIGQHTLEVVADSYGIVDSIGTQVLSNAVQQRRQQSASSTR